jgi:hypothetical protein
MQEPNGGEFTTPGNIVNCEVNYQRDNVTGVLCFTGKPAESVNMSASGKYTVCKGENCLANDADGTPTLAYGTATGAGPFRCESAVAGVTCTANGKGFRISGSGITPVPA